MDIIRQPFTFFAVPDFRNLGIMVKIYCSILFFILLWPLCFMHFPNWGYFPIFWNLVLWVTPSTICTLALLAYFNNYIHANPHPAFLVWFISIVTVVIIEEITLINNHNLLQHIIGVSIFVLFGMHYFSLLQRALSPAISEAKLAALTARIRPHFLFNSLNAAISLIDTRPSDAEMVLENLSELFRAQLKSNELRSNLASEITLCRDYLSIEEIRMGTERLNTAWHIQAPDDTEIPHLLLQPLLENAVYHGIEPYHRPGTIQINIIRKKAWLYIRIENPASDTINFTNKREGNQMAMKNIRERLYLLYDQDAKLTHHRIGDRYQVNIRMPFRTY